MMLTPDDFGMAVRPPTAACPDAAADEFGAAKLPAQMIDARPYPSDFAHSAPDGCGIPVPSKNLKSRAHSGLGPGSPSSGGRGWHRRRRGDAIARKTVKERFGREFVDRRA